MNVSESNLAITATYVLMISTYTVHSLLLMACISICGAHDMTYNHVMVNEGKPLCGSSRGAQSFGYVTVSDETRYFYALVDADDKTENTPTFVFLPGGPAASALVPALTMVGPCHISTKDEKMLLTNEFSWTKKANGIFIDAPGGTGFSLGKYEATMDDFVDNIYKTLLAIIEREPHVKDNLHLVGYSFDGSTATLLAKKVISSKGDNKINLKKLLILSGSMGPIDMYRGAVEMARNRKLLHPDVIAKMATDSYTCAEKLKPCQPTSSRPQPDPVACAEAFRFCDDALTEPLHKAKISQYDVRVKPGFESEYFELQSGRPGKYMNEKSVQDAMGTHKYWIPSDPQVFSAFEKYGAYDTTAVVSELLDSGLQVMVFNGDQDFVCNSIGAYHWVTNLNGRVNYGKILARAKPKTLKFKLGGPLGTMRKAVYANGASLALVEVLEGSHVFPLNKPLEMRQAIEYFFTE